MKIYVYTKPLHERLYLIMLIRMVRACLRRLKLKDSDLYKVLKQELYHGNN